VPWQSESFVDLLDAWVWLYSVLAVEVLPPPSLHLGGRDSGSQPTGRCGALLPRCAFLLRFGSGLGFGLCRGLSLPELLDTRMGGCACRNCPDDWAPKPIVPVDVLGGLALALALAMLAAGEFLLVELLLVRCFLLGPRTASALRQLVLRRGFASALDLLGAPLLLQLDLLLVRILGVGSFIRGTTLRVPSAVSKEWGPKHGCCGECCAGIGVYLLGPPKGRRCLCLCLDGLCLVGSG
jgi:hypothetical protein